MLVSTVYDHIDLIVDTYDNMVSGVIRATGLWEGRNIRTMARFIKEGQVILNIGSHVGLEAIVFGKIVGASGKLHVIEPYSSSYNMLLKNIYLNNLQHISHVYNVGASNKPGSGFISVSMQNTGGSEIFTKESVKKNNVQTE